MAILKADLEYKRRWLLLYAAMAITVFGIALWGLPALMEHLQAKAPADALRFIQIVLIILFAPLLLMAYSLYRIARRIQASGQCPPPGVKVIRDTEILEGNAARRKGRLLFVSSILLFTAAFLGMVYLPYLVGKLEEVFIPKQQSNTLLQPTGYASG
jgi:hypothetical protein